MNFAYAGMGGTEESLVMETKPFIEFKASQEGQDLPGANEKEQIIDAIGGEKNYSS